MLSKFLSFMERYFLPVASKLGGNRHLVAIRDSFAVAMPLILVGSVAVLLNNIWDAVDKLLNTNIKATLQANAPWFFEINGTIWWGTFSIFSVFMAVSVGYRLAKSYGDDGIVAGVISLAAFFINIPQLREVNGEMQWGLVFVGDLGIVSLFAIIIISIISTELYIRLMKAKWNIKMPEGVPPAVAKAFLSIIPAMVVLYLFAIVAVIFAKNPIMISGKEVSSIISLIGAALQAPFMSLGQNLFTILIVSLFIPLFWFTGLHGGNILAPVINTVYLPAVLENADALQNGWATPNIWTSVSWDVYVNFGGAGATLALIIAVYLFSKRKDYRAVAKMSFAPGVFMINEPVIFGLPVVLNPLIFVPFVLNPLILTVIAYFATSVGLVPPVSVIIPWTTPPVIGAFIATGGSFAAALLAIFNFAISILVYIPFIILLNKESTK